jgi:glycosidase
MTGNDEPTTRQDFPGGFPGDRRNAFTRAGRTAPEQDLFDHVRKVARLHAELEPLRRGTLRNLYIAEQQYAYARETGRATVIVVINNDRREATVEFKVPTESLSEGSALVDRLGASGDVHVRGGALKVSMPARSASIFAAR